VDGRSGQGLSRTIKIMVTEPYTNEGDQDEKVCRIHGGRRTRICLR
jgi:hypothetical protein